MLMIENFTSQTPISLDLIHEKISIPAPVNHIPRPRLLNLLHESLKFRVSTIIYGRAGSGKTVLATDFAGTCGRPVAWYKVDAPDGDLKVFFQYLISGIRRERPAFGQENLLPLLRSAEVAEGAEVYRIPRLAEAFIYELQNGAGGGDNGPLLIVIEDLHLVCDAQWVVPFFQRLLPLLPSDVHVLITSRTMPPAPFWRMRSKQMLSVIDEAALSFNRSEAIELFESRGLSRERATIALDHAHGRPAALDAAANLMVSSVDGVARAAAAE
jgi:LuxR family maltose regulon positive regulatory protein